MHSKTYGRDFEVELCPSYEDENYKVISHKSLQDICDIEMRGIFDCKFEVLKDNVNHALVKCLIKDTGTGYTIEEIGEKIKVNGEGEIAQQFPVTSAYTRAFDRAMIRMMGFEGKFYSDQEMSDKKKTASVSRNFSDIPGDIETQQEIFEEDNYDAPVGEADVTLNIPDYEAIAEDEVEAAKDSPIEPSVTTPVVDAPADEDVPTDEPVADVSMDAPVVDEPEPEKPATTPKPSVPESDPGDYRMRGGTREGKTIREIYDNGQGKGWLDYYLGGPKASVEVKKLIVRFYLANGIPGPDGSYKEDATALQKEIHTNAKKVYENLAAEIKKGG